MASESGGESGVVAVQAPSMLQGTLTRAEGFG